MASLTAAPLRFRPYDPHRDPGAPADNPT